MIATSRQFAAGVLAMLVLVGGIGCRSAGVPPVEAPPARGTLAGSVFGPEGVAPVEGRLVEAVEVDTGFRYGTKTNAAGGFSLMLPPGRYRLEVALGPGESILEDPGVVTLEPSQLAHGQDVTLGGAGVVEPS
jgi:hypothetical protein